MKSETANDKCLTGVRGWFTYRIPNAFAGVTQW